MLSHYWKIGTFIRFHQNRLGWGGKVISQLAQAIRMKYLEKKGYSHRNLSYICQFARLYPISVLQTIKECDSVLKELTLDKVLHITDKLNGIEFMREPLAQIENMP